MIRSLIALAAVLCTQMASATTTYTYQGPRLTNNFVAPFVQGDALTGFITFAQAPVTGDYGAADFTDYAFTIGAMIMSKAAGADLGTHVVFDAGQITHWSFGVGRYPASLLPPTSLVEIMTSSSTGDRITVNTADGRTVFAAITPPGAWAINSPVPEPASSALMLIGMAAVAAHRDNSRTQRARHTKQ